MSPVHSARMTSTASSSISAPDLPLGPALAEDVLVEPLARAHAEEEPTRHQGGCRCGGLGDDRRVDPDRGARHAGADAIRVVASAIAPRTPTRTGCGPGGRPTGGSGRRSGRTRNPRSPRGRRARRGRGARAPRWTGHIRCRSCRRLSAVPLAAARPGVAGDCTRVARRNPPGPGPNCDAAARGVPAILDTARMTWDRSSLRHPPNRRNQMDAIALLTDEHARCASC